MSKPCVNDKCIGCFALSTSRQTCMACRPCDRYGICKKCCLGCSRRLDRRESVGGFIEPSGYIINDSTFYSVSTSGTLTITNGTI